MVSGGDGSVSAYDRVRQGQYQAATIPEPLNLHGWQAIDEMNRAFAGAPPSGYVTPGSPGHPGQHLGRWRPEQHLRSRQRLSRPVQEDLGHRVRSQEAGMSTSTSTGKVLSKNIKLITQSDQGGRPDGVQLMVHRGYAYIAHIFSNGVSVMDVRDPKNPKPVNFIPAFGKNWNIHLQTHEDLLFVIDEFNFYANEAFCQGGELLHPIGRGLDQAGGRQCVRRTRRRLQRGLPGVRHLEARPAAPDRPVLDRGTRLPPHVVRGRPVPLCLGLAGRLQRPHDAADAVIHRQAVVHAVARAVRPSARQTSGSIA